MRFLRRKTYELLLFLCMSGFSGSPVYADETNNPVKFVKLAVPAQDLFFKSLLPRTMISAGFDYVSLERPFNRAIWSLGHGEIELIGPYPEQKVEDYLSSVNLERDKIVKIPLEIDHIPMFGLSLTGAEHASSYISNKKLRIGFLRGNSIKTKFRTQTVMQVATLEQLAALLKIRRIDTIILPKALSDQLIRDNPNLGLYTSLRPVYFEKTFLYTNKELARQVHPIIDAYKKIKKTDFYQQVWEKYSHEKDWQD